MSRLDVDAVMRGLRDAVGANGASVAPDAEADALPVTAAGMPALPRRDRYVLGELLAGMDVAFVENAYAALLRRAARPDELAALLAPLRAGTATKVDLLAALHDSAEARAIGVQVEGLARHARLMRLKRRRLVGPLVAWVHGILRAGSQPIRTGQLEARLAAELHEIAAETGRVSSRLHDARSGIARLQAAMPAQLEAARRETADSEARLQALVSLQAREIQALAQRLAVLEQAGALDARLDALEAEATRLSLRGDAMQARLEQAEDALAGPVAALEAQRIAQDEAARREAARQMSLDALYVAFEQRFRGDTELVKARVLPYVEVIREANVGTHLCPVLDIGCGSGEFLEVLREHEVVARGIDLNALAVELARGRGLDVAVADALECLRAQPDGALGGITAIHVAEHLPFEVLIDLLDECRRVLCIGGVLILETPNPENARVGSHDFYMDPTHRNPIPPEALRWFVEARGFQRCRIERLTQDRPTHGPPRLPGDDAIARSVNALTAHFDAPLDYAVIARRL